MWVDFKGFVVVVVRGMCMHAHMHAHMQCTYAHVHVHVCGDGCWGQEAPSKIQEVTLMRPFHGNL